MRHKKYPKYKNSGIGWLGNVPEGWEVVAFKELFKPSNERVKDDPSVGMPISVSGYRGVEPRDVTSMEGQMPSDDVTEYRIVRKGQLAVNTMWLNHTGLGVSEYEGYTSPAYRSYNIKRRINKRYVHHLLRSPLYVQKYTGLLYGVRPNSLQVKTHDFEHIEILLPPLKTQKRIADFLDEKTKVINELVAKKERLLELLKEKRTALITRAVTKGLDPHTKLKSSGVAWLGDIPEGWVIKKLKYITSANRKSLSENSTSPDFEFDYVDIGNVNSEGRILELQNYFFANAPTRARRLAENGDVIISTVRTYLRAMARIKIAGGLVFSTGFTVLHPTRIIASQLYWSMQSEVFLAHVMANSTGVNYPGINEQKLSSIPLPIPSEEEQKQISDFLDTETAKIDKAVELIESQIEKLKEYRSSLIYSAVTGKIKI